MSLIDWVATAIMLWFFGSVDGFTQLYNQFERGGDDR